MKKETHTIPASGSRTEPSVPASPPKPKPGRTDALSVPLHGPGLRAMYFFCISLRSCITSGVPIIRAFALMSEQADSLPLRRACYALSRDLDGGMPIEKAFNRRRSAFSPFFIQLLLTGLRTGSVVHSLDLLIEHYRWVWDVRTALLRTMIYPLFLLIAGALIMALKDVAILQIQGELTAAAAVNASVHYFKFPVFGAAAAFICSRILKSRLVRPLTDEIAMRLPIIRKHYRQKSLAIFYRVLATAIESGMEVGAAFQSAISAMDNHVMARRLRRAERYIRDGDSFYEALTFSKALDAQALAMVRVGEASGSMPELIRRLAGYYMDETQAMSVGWAKSLYPLMIVIVAVAYFANVAFLGIGTFVILFFIFMTV